VAFEQDEYCLWAPSRGMGDAVKTSDRRQTNSYRALGGILGRFPLSHTPPHPLIHRARIRVFYFNFFSLSLSGERAARPPSIHRRRAINTHYAAALFPVRTWGRPSYLFCWQSGGRGGGGEGDDEYVVCCTRVISTITRAFV